MTNFIYSQSWWRHFRPFEVFWQSDRFPLLARPSMREVVGHSSPFTAAIDIDRTLVFLKYLYSICQIFVWLLGSIFMSYGKYFCICRAFLWDWQVVWCHRHWLTLVNLKYLSNICAIVVQYLYGICMIFVEYLYSIDWWSPAIAIDWPLLNGHAILHVQVCYLSPPLHKNVPEIEI